MFKLADREKEINTVWPETTFLSGFVCTSARLQTIFMPVHIQNTMTVTGQLGYKGAYAGWSSLNMYDVAKTRHIMRFFFMPICAKCLVMNTFGRLTGRSPRIKTTPHPCFEATVPDLNTQTTHPHVQKKTWSHFFFFFLSPSDAPIIPAAAGTLAFPSVQTKTAGDSN